MSLLDALPADLDGPTDDELDALDAELPTSAAIAALSWDYEDNLHTHPRPFGLTPQELEVREERRAQILRFGEQAHPDGTGAVWDVDHANSARAACDAATEAGTLTWKDILEEEVAEAFAESDPVALYVELTQVEAVARAWREHLATRLDPTGTR